MASANAAAVSAFIEGAPPGELTDVVADIKALTPNDPALLQSAKPAFESYNEEQLTTVKLPGGGKPVLISSYNSLGGGRYYDVETQSSFAFDHTTQKASAVQLYSLDSQHVDLIMSNKSNCKILNFFLLLRRTALQKSLSTHAGEHYPNSTVAIYPISSDSTLVLLLVANKYSPSNFWNGRFRTIYQFTPKTASLSGSLKCDVHYYEDGNVRLTTSKNISPTTVSSTSSTSSSSATAIAIAKIIAATELKYHEELNRGFTKLSEGEFKALRRQLPVTRQKVEWEKIGGYRLGQDIGGARAR
ncbi:F-actin-capping protein subunit alpha [Pseudocyphellaria aurata]|nr:F-actin-capping protein subunit alpha [Pseudocyphellaria aurata]